MRLGIGLGTVDREHNLTSIQKAIGVLKKLSSSPAGIFTAGQGYLQTPGNLLTYSRDYSNAAWGKTNLTPSATAIIPDATSGIHRVNASVTIASAAPFTTAIRASANGYRYLYINGAASPNVGQACFDLQTGTVAATANGAATIAAVGDGSYICAVSGTSVGTLLSPFLQVNNAAVATDTTFSGNGVDGIVTYGSGSFAGTYTASQLLAMGGIPLTTAAAVPAVYTNASVYQAGSTQVSYGQELNNTPLSAWTYGGWTYNTSGQYIDSSGGTGSAYLPAAAPVVGKVYTFTFTSSGTNTMNLVVGNTFTGANPVIGVNTFDAPCNTAGPFLGFQGGATNNQIRNISVREKITQSAAINSLLSNNYILSDGSTGFSAVDGPVGLALDGAGSVGGEQVAAATSWVTFGVSTGTTINTGAASITFTGAAAAFSGVTIQGANSVIGKTYLATFTVSGYVAGSVQIQAGASSGFVAANGTYQFYIPATGAGPFTIQIGATPLNGVVSNISVKEVTGIHATQATTANKPTVRRGLYNQFKYANVSSGIGTDYNGMFGGVGSNGVLTANYGLAPDGTMTAARAQLSLNGGTTTADRSGITGVGAPIDSLVRTMAVYLKSLSGSPTVLTRVNGSVVYTTLNTSTWTMVPVSGSSGADSTTNLVEIRGGQTPTNSNTADVLVWGAGLFTGTLTAQQILDSGGIPLTTSAAASNASAGRYSWGFDGGDSLALGSVPFQLSDNSAVVFAYRLDDTSSNKTLFSIVGTSGTPIACHLNVASGAWACYYRDDAATTRLIAAPAPAAGVTAIASLRKVGNAAVLRVNGVQVGSADLTGLGACTVTAAAVGCFAQGTPSNFAIGAISDGIAIKGTLSDADMLTLERFAASTLPNAPSF